MRPNVDIKAVAETALRDARGLLERWFPAGKHHGHEFKVGDLSGNPGDSLSVNTNTGQWADFAAGVKGGDLVSLHAARMNLSQVDAARELADMLGTLPPASNDNAPAKKRAQWSPLPTAPREATAAELRHPVHGAPSRFWTYRTATGEVIGHVCRFDMADGGKEIIPLAWCGDGRRTQWRWLSFAKPRPLYGLDRLAQRPGVAVIVTEGEKDCDAAQALFPQYVAVTWPGGSSAVKHADWSPLAGRKVVIWPDADSPGIKAATTAVDALEPHGCAVRVVQPEPDWATGAGAADFTPDDPLAWLRQHLVEPSQLRDIYDEPELPPDTWEHPDEPLPPEPVVDDDAPFQALGYDHGEYFYLSRFSQQVHQFSAAAHTEKHLLSLAPLRYWQRAYPAKGERTPFNVTQAANALMRQCESAGVYDPDRIRGRGAWWDDGKAVIHLGDRIVMGGEEIELSRVRSRYVYEAATPMRANFREPLGNRDAHQLLELCKLLPWERQLDALLLAGWCVVAPVCGALAWRPHIWITGSAGTGKSWCMDNIVRRALGDSALSVQGETTEAGLRQTLWHDAKPVVFDEAEGENNQAAQRIQNVMALMRQASSENGAAIYKGAANGKAQSFRIRSCFAFASISVGVQQHADHTRVTVLSLAVDHGIGREEREARFENLKAVWARTMTREYVERLHARTINLIPVIRANAETFAMAGTKVLGARRAGDQIGTLLAGAYALHRSDAITLDGAEKWLRQHQWEDTTTTQEQADELKCLYRIMETIVRAQAVGSTVDRTMGELVEAVVRGDPDVSASVADDTLRRYGVKVDALAGTLMISNTASAIEKMLANTPWARNWGRILKRIEGAVTTVPVRIGPGGTTRATAVPLELVTG